MNRKLLWIGVVALLMAALPAAGQPDHGGRGAVRAADADSDWPSTRAGALARGWVTAFSSGEAEMKAFLAKELAPKSLETTKLPKRIERYRDLREKYGRLQFASVVKSTPGELTVKLMDEEASLHEFTFTVQTEAPFKLVSVSIKQRGHFGGGGHGFGH